MSTIAMTVEGLGKRYRIGGRAVARSLARDFGRERPGRGSRTSPLPDGRGSAGTPAHSRDAASDNAGSLPYGRGSDQNDVAAGPRTGRSDAAPVAAGPRTGRFDVAGPRTGRSDEFWALRAASFDVRRGEVVGVIGRNGAGKSTLLKLLSRITEPTEGRARIRGRVRSLLEVGTGFHPELTGRDNVYLNGALLGMRRAEIRRKFDEIIAFADVERFLDTPVKRYSSGMAVRLGFAVAAHLEPEILLVDEVLAVGDLGFQRKCLGKMKDVAGDGRTVLFVSHGMAAVRQLCPRVILIDGGRIVCDGAAEESIEAYRALFRERRDIPPAERTDREGTGRMRIVEAVVRDAETGHVGVVAAGHTAEFRFVVRRPALQDPNLLASLAFRMSLFDAQSQCLAHCCNAISGERLEAGGGEFAVSCVVPRLPLNRGAYTLSASVGDAHETYDYLLDVAAFDVTPGPFYTTGRLPEADHSSLLMDYRWSTQESP